MILLARNPFPSSRGACFIRSSFAWSRPGVISAGEGASLPHPGAAFFMAAATLLLAAVVGWWVARQAEREEAAAV